MAIATLSTFNWGGLLTASEVQVITVRTGSMEPCRQQGAGEVADPTASPSQVLGLQNCGLMPNKTFD